jgi:outer membrane murein-binding lipoprotein Lpp
MLAIVFSAVSLAGCTSEQDKREQVETNIQSWAATLSVVGEQWSAKHVPNRFARAAVDRVQQGIQQELSTLPPDPINDDLRARGRELVGRTEQLRTAIQRAESGAPRAIPAQ